MYNTKLYIGKTIESITKQSYKNWELIIVDDNSSDNSLNIVKQYAKLDERIKIFKLPTNSGAAAARNRAIREADGDFFAFIDSDDIWKSDKLEKQLSFMESNNYSFTCTYYGKINAAGRNLNLVIKSPNKMNYNQLLLNGPGNSTVMYNAKKLGKTFIPCIKKRNDYLMWLRVIKKAENIYCLEEELSFHRLREGSISANKLKLIKYHWMIYRKYESISFFKSIVVLTVIILRGMKLKVVQNERK